MNKELQTFARDTLKSDLAKFPEGWQIKFKLMYRSKEMDINEVVDVMSEEKLDWAMQQVANSIEKIKKSS